LLDGCGEDCSIEDYVANKDISLLCNLIKETDISEVHAASFITLMMKAVCLLKCLTPTRLHSAISQMAIIFILAAVRT
jgi:hypothetical protein